MSLRMTSLGCVLIAMAALVAGCGGGDEPPTLKEDYINKVDRLCAADDRRTTKAAQAFQDAIKEDDYAAAALVVTGLQISEAATIEEIEAIDPPEADQLAIDEYLSLSRQMNELDADIAAAVKSEDREASDAAEMEGDLLLDRRDRLADDYGLVACGSGETAP